MKRQFSIAEAKNKLPSIIHQVEKGPSVKLTRRGEPVAVLLSVDEYERMGQKRGGLWKALTAFRKVLRDRSVQITDADFDGLRDPSPGRKVPFEG